MSQKKIYQHYINSGAIGNVSELIKFVAERRLTLTRSSSSYVGVKNEDGRRFRLFLPSHPKAGKAGFKTGPVGKWDFWIYALLACSSHAVACYVGQTRHIPRRIQEHWRRRFGAKASGPLFVWAGEHDIDVNFVLLQSLHGRQADANNAENEWKVRAVRSGLCFPSRESLNTAKRRFAATDPWPLEAALHHSQPIEQLATNVVALATVEENSVLCSHGYLRPQDLDDKVRVLIVNARRSPVGDGINAVTNELMPPINRRKRSQAS